MCVGSALILVVANPPISSLHQGESDVSTPVILVIISLCVGSFMVLIASIISVMVPVCVVKYAKQHGNVTLASKTT